MKIEVGAAVVELDLEDGDIVSDIVLIAKVERVEDPRPTLHVSRSDGTDHFAAVGMVIQGGDYMRGIDGSGCSRGQA